MGLPRQTFLPTVIPPSTDSAVATNTLILTNLLPAAFEDDGFAVRELLLPFGSLARLSLLTSFMRIVAVFDSTADSLRTKESLHMTDFLGRELRVYFGEHTDMTHLTNPEQTGIHFLRVPEPEKNFLLSPPGSPPIGWIQIRESSPVAGGHEDALIDALRELERDEFTLDEGAQLEDRDEARTEGVDGVQVLRFGRSEEEGGEWELPMIVVENMELRMAVAEGSGGLGGRPPTPLPRTSMPPMMGA
ncbi:hypothetical protein HDV00_009390 [Rhizophlyctis rosea]|nr:hypothetical protein HDV00_009390 [Rhizophlyctis rosea]